MEKMDLHQKILLIIVFLLLLFNILSVFNSPATHYEPDIYKSLPINFIPLTIISTAIIFFMFLKYPVNKPTLAGIILNYSIILLLPILKSYFLWNTNGDIGTHLGSIISLVSRGSIDSLDLYPHSKILIVFFNLVLDINLPFSLLFIPFITAIIALPFYYLISTYICKEKYYQKIITILSCCFIGGMFITYSPNNFTNLLFPMCIYLILLYYKNKTIEHFIPLLIIIIILPLLHIIVSISFIILLISFISYKSYLINNFNRVVILAVVISISWISTFYIWLQMINKVITLFEDTNKTSAGAIVNQIEYAGQFNIDLISYILFTYGITIILFISFIIMLYYSNKNQIIINFNKFYIFIALLILIQFFMYTGFSPLRFLVSLNIIAIFYLGLILFKTFSKEKFQYSKAISLIFIIIIFTTGLLTVFPSSSTLLPNYQTTSMEMDGAKWFYKQSDFSYNITGISIAPGRYAAFLLDDDDPRKSQIPLYFDNYNTCPYHFNYTEPQSNHSSYLLLTEKDRVLYTEVYPFMAESRWNEDDFEKLNFFIGIDKVYSNSDVVCWITSGE